MAQIRSARLVPSWNEVPDPDLAPSWREVASRAGAFTLRFNAPAASFNRGSSPAIVMDASWARRDSVNSTLANEPEMSHKPTEVRVGMSGRTAVVVEQPS